MGILSNAFEINLYQMSPLQDSLESTQVCLCVQYGRLLGFVISKEGICVNPLKVEAILNLRPPSNISQLQSFKGKAKFLH